MPPLDADLVGTLSAAGPSWLEERRRRALEAFQALPMPSPKEEVWRYIDLDFDLADFAPASGEGSALAPDAEIAAALGPAAASAVIVDGIPRAVAAGDGLVLAPLADAVADERMRAAFGLAGPPEADRFRAAHAAFQPGALVLRVPRNATPDRPVSIEVHAVEVGAVSFPHLTIVVEENAAASVVVNFRSEEGPFLVVPHIEAVVDAAARLSVTVLQSWGPGTTAVAEARFVAGRDATVRFGEVGLGGKLARLRLGVDLQGAGSSADIVGVYFGDREQVLDYRYFMTHSGPSTTSDMFLKGAVEDEADSVFTGLIRIEESAQKTNAFQTNRNLVLSADAQANSVPNLEILANDVKCGHGSTMGPLDEEQRYYLMSRGLDRLRADRLQVRGFFEEAILRLPAPAVAGPVRERINHKFVAAQQEGRV